MFGSTIIDVAIGLIFVYLLLSLICSAVVETIEKPNKRRARDLHRGLCQLLNDKSGQGLVRKLYEHPLIDGLFDGAYSKQVNSSGETKRGTKLPSYIPSGTLALALMNLLGIRASRPVTPAPVVPAPVAPAPVASAPAASAPAAAVAIAATPLTDPSVPFPARITKATSLIEDETGATIPLAIGDIVTVEGLPTTVVAAMAVQGGVEHWGMIPAGTYVPLNSAGFVGTRAARHALLTLVGAAGGDEEKARKNVQQWIDDSMDRVSGQFKRYTQTAVLIIGTIIVLASNADTLAIVDALSKDRVLRDSLVSAAQEFQRHPPDSVKNLPQTEPDPRPGPQTKPAPTSQPALIDGNVIQQTAQALSNLKGQGLPIGWNRDDPRSVPPLSGWPAKIIGLLLTVAAITLGAPFWFDQLNKIMVIRATVKPREKSPEEPAVDRK